MSAEARLKVVLCWHMHQPEYRDPASGEYQLPWTYLHAIKDYTDMAAHLEAVPGARAVVNFAPILLDQIADYTEQVTGFLDSRGAIRDPLLSALACPVLPANHGERLHLIRACLRANEKRLIERFPGFARLARVAHMVLEHPDAVQYLNDEFLGDLLVWYHLAWTGETVRRNDVRIARLMKKEKGYSMEDRHLMLEVIGDLLRNLLGRYRALAEQGRVELSMTPYAHPILPLMLDLHSAREAVPDILLPGVDGYPGGEARARWHIEAGRETFRRHFGFAPSGCWPAEGAVSTAALRLLGEYGFAWAATGEGVLHNSLGDRSHDRSRESWLYRPYAVGGNGIHCFFRDDQLSDLIGFTYSDWHGDDAVNNLVHRLEEIATHDHGAQVVSIILDGENAWEYYPENGYHFLGALYQRLADHPQLELTTFSDALRNGAQGEVLDGMVAGSWVYGSFTTWIGEKDKNRGWEMLADAKRRFDIVAESGKLTGERYNAAVQQLAICEGSDWCWWFGDYNPSDTVSDFEHLYRAHLASLYQIMDQSPPEYLSQVMSHGGGSPLHGGAMRPGQVGA